MMNLRKLGIVTIIALLINNAIYPLISLPAIVLTITLAATAILLFMGVSRGGAMGKVYLILSVLIAIYAAIDILSFVGISLPVSFIYVVYTWVIIAAVALLLIQFFTN